MLYYYLEMIVCRFSIRKSGPATGVSGEAGSKPDGVLREVTCRSAQSSTSIEMIHILK